jgi:hypothetical protein
MRSTILACAPSNSYTATGVHHTFSGCYADAGTVAISMETATKSGKTVTVLETLTFLSTTPSTGAVTVKIGSAADSTAVLPAHGTCPHP